MILRVAVAAWGVVCACKGVKNPEANATRAAALQRRQSMGEHELEAKIMVIQRPGAS